MRHQSQFRMLLSALLVLAGAAMSQGVFAQDAAPEDSPVCPFVDEDGDGFNDLAPDQDGDGIPNALDPDYVAPQDGTGSQNGGGFKFMFGWLDQLFGRFALEDESQNGHMFGVRDGSGTSFGPVEGTGFGPGAGDGGNGQGSAGGDAGGPGGFGGNGSGGNGNGGTGGSGNGNG